MKDHLLTHKEKSYKCHVCDNSFPKACRLNEHYQKAHQNNQTEKLQCNLCPMFYYKKVSLRHHVNNKHGELSACTYCEKSFTSYKLKTHITNVHGTPNLVECETCHKSLPENSMKRHIATHNDRIYFCDVCDKSYAFASHLNEHYKRAHERK